MGSKGSESEFTKEIASDICLRVACGESIRSISRDENMPAMSTIFKWLVDVEGFSDQYIKAKDRSAEVDFEKIHEIVEDVLSGDVETQAGRVAIDAYKWTSSQKKPKKYGVNTNKLVGHDDGAIKVDNKWEVVITHAKATDTEQV